VKVCHIRRDSIKDSIIFTLSLFMSAINISTSNYVFHIKLICMANFTEAFKIQLFALCESKRCSANYLNAIDWRLWLQLSIDFTFKNRDSMNLNYQL